jgi:DNA end-binding protein Ku
VYVERPYYLAPDGNVAAEAFAVMREGMAGKAAIGKVALYGREYLVAIQPRENGLVMYTLRHAAEVRAMSAIDELKLVPARIKPDEVKLARQVIGSFETEGDLTQYKDEYQDALRKVIDAKVAGEEVATPAEEAPPKVVDLMEALRQSLERVSATKKRAARIEAGPSKSAPRPVEIGRNRASEPPAKKRARG